MGQLHSDSGASGHSVAARIPLSWPAAEQPWSDGDELMLRIRETGSARIVPPTLAKSIVKT